MRILTWTYLSPARARIGYPKIWILTEGLRLAVSEILTTAYVELVLKAPTALERASGMTFAHLMWLEMLEQVELGHTMPGSAVNGQVVNRQAALERLLRVVAQKQKAASFLQRLKEWRLKPRVPMRGLGWWPCSWANQRGRQAHLTSLWYDSTITTLSESSLRNRSFHTLSRHG